MTNYNCLNLENQAAILFSEIGEDKKSWWQKIKSVFEKRNRLFYATEMFKVLERDESEFKKEKFNRELMHRNVFSVFTKKTKEGELRRIKVGKEYIYGLGHWFNSDGTIKEEYFKTYSSNPE